MKRVLILTTAMLMTQTVLWAAPFTQGNLVIYRVGDGTSLLTNQGNYAYLDELTTNGTLVQSIPLTQNQFTDGKGVTQFPIINSGAALSEGLITLSTDGRYVVFSGYAASTNWSGTPANLTTGAGAFISRVVGRAGADGSIDTSTAGIFASSGGGNPRGVASTDGSNFWVTSSTEGVGYTTLGSTDPFVVLQANNDRGIAIYDSRADLSYPGNVQIYFTSSTRLTSFGTNLPTTVTFNTNLVGISSTVTPFRSPYGFVAFPLQAGGTNIDTIYLADEGSNVSKWCYSPITASWSNFGSIDTSVGPNGIGNPCGIRSVTASVGVSGNQTNVHLYFLSGCGSGGGGGTVYHITDSSGYNGTLTGTWPAPIANTATIFAAHPLVVWRGIAFAPANTLQITSATKSGSNIPITWNAVGGNSYVVQASPGDAHGGYTTNNFVDISPTNFVPSLGYSQTNYVDIGGGTNNPSRYYRVRQVAKP
jgi:hypothetical protein